MSDTTAVPICDHWLPTGIRCAAPALGGKNYCRHHNRFYDAEQLPAPGTTYVPPVPDHPEAALLSVHQAVRAFLAGRIDEKSCRLLIWAAQIESSILRSQATLERVAYHRALVSEREEERDAAARQNVEREFGALFKTLQSRIHP